MDYRERWELKHYLIAQLLERRIRLIHVGVFLLLLVFLLNFFYLQGVRGDDYVRLAENNRLRRVAMRPTRGEIVDRNGTVIASTRPSLKLMLQREGATRLELRAQLGRLSPILNVSAEELSSRLESQQSRPRFEPLALRDDVQLAQLAKIEARRETLPSVRVEQSARRHYTYDDLFVHAVGFVGEVSMDQLNRQDEEGGLRSGDIVGKSGVERRYDDLVRGTRGWKLVSVNNLGRQMGDAGVGTPPDHGRQLELTIDLELQRTLRDALGDEVGAGVFLDPWTGSVLALVSTPTFDPNMFADGISTEDWKTLSTDPRRPMHDRVIASFHAPGSTFKMVLAVAGLETGVVTPQTTVNCLGSAVHYGRSRLCWKRGGHGVVDLKRALTESCNVYFYKLGRELGIDAIAKYGAMFNLGRLTGIDIPGEDKGIMPSRQWKRETLHEPWYPGDTISVAIGQGYLAATPLQMATVVSAIATDGHLPRPHLLAGNTVDSQKLEISQATLKLVREGLENVVRTGTATRAAMGNISVAGKTGTAQVFAHSAGVDSDDLPKAERDHAWFVGYAPADRPRIAFAVVVEHGGHGGAISAPIARKVLEAFFRQLERGGKGAAPSTAG